MPWFLNPGEVEILFSKPHRFRKPTRFDKKKDCNEKRD